MKVKLTDTHATLADKRWQEQADQLASQGLAQVRATATQWTTTIGALSTLFGLGLVIKGRADLAGLAPGTALAVGLLSLTALVLSIAAVFTGALAAQGTPSKFRDSGPELKTWTMNQAKKARAYLRLSRGLILLGLAALVISMAVDWYGPLAATTSAH